MQYKQLGTTGLQVSQLCFGTMTFGAEASKKESHEMFSLAKEKGINFFDCANKYANGESERILGECIKDCRDEVIITTKAASRVNSDVNSIGLSRKHLMLELEKSLKRLNSEYIDIYYLHYFDPYTNMEDTMRFLDDAVKQGKILYTGVSNWSAWQIMKAIHISKTNFLQTIDCIQPMYSLVKRQAEVELFPLAIDQNLAVVPYSPIGSGLLTGKYSTKNNNESTRLNEKDYYNQRYMDENYHNIANKFCSFAKDNGFDSAQLAISWAMNNDAVTAPIVGARNSKQLQSNLEAININMTQELREEISKLSITPPPAHDRLEENIDINNKLR
ncbi:aldo/keto reductase [Halarcobacter anaerophilus]|jgi:aryl-alcohol dehydrogenase-like predicted oxidoreductase|uniref:aldo/keto reductase n=1 Tax=Halarcobacter anaerophilus TaxID=877500 RepID=UPI0005C9E0BA|nr:aldo/keto reductase [Halarcobacter anaerophilus]